MKLDELLDLTLREVLEKYCAVENLECGYSYGVFKQEDVNKLYEEYNIDDDYPEAFCPVPLISSEISDVCDDVREYDILVRIMDNLGISKKSEK